MYHFCTARHVPSCIALIALIVLISLIALISDSLNLHHTTPHHTDLHSNLFVFGGRDSFDNQLSDLFRFNVMDSSWTQLTPVNFDIAWDVASSVGSNLVLSLWGLLRYGGYSRLPTLNPHRNYSSYAGEVHVLDPVTLRWSYVPVQSAALSVNNMYGSTVVPMQRYLSAAAFLPYSALPSRSFSSYRWCLNTNPVLAQY